MPFPFIPLAIAGGSALANAIGGRKQTSTQKIDQTTNSQNSTSGTTTGGSTSSFNQSRELDPEITGARNTLFQKLLAGLNPDTGFIKNYGATGLSNINRGYDAQKRALGSNLAARGLAYSPGAAYGQAGIDSARIGEGVNFLNQMPLLAEQIRRQRMQDAAGFISSAPYGTTTSGNESRDTFSQFNTDQTGTNRVTGTTTGTTPNTSAAGGIGGLFQTLAYLAGSGALNLGGGGGGGGSADLGL